MSDSRNSRTLTIAVGVALIAACVMVFMWKQQRPSYNVPRAAHAAAVNRTTARITSAGFKPTRAAIERSRRESLKRCGAGQLVWVTGSSRRSEYHTAGSAAFGKGSGTYACLSDVYQTVPLARD